jgi:hypothetical protein
MKWRYAVDTDVLVLIQRAGHVSSLKRLGSLPVVITDMVWGELTSQAAKGKAPRRIVQEAEELLSAIAGKPTEFPRGLHRGIEELRGRTLSVHGFLDVLRTHHGLESKIADEISSWYCKHFRPQRPPLWW